MRTLLTSALCAALLSCGPGVAWAAPAPDAADMSKPATEHTRAAHAAMSKEVDFADRQDFQDAQRGFLAPLPDRGRILESNGRETWNLAPYDFLAPAMSRDFPPSVIMPTQAPDTVNPSLWRQSQLVLRDGRMVIPGAPGLGLLGLPGLPAAGLGIPSGPAPGGLKFSGHGKTSFQWELVRILRLTGSALAGIVQQIPDGGHILSAAAVHPGNTAADAADEFVVEAVRRLGDLLHGDGFFSAGADEHYLVTQSGIGYAGDIYHQLIHAYPAQNGRAPTPDEHIKCP